MLFMLETIINKVRYGFGVSKRVWNFIEEKKLLHFIKSLNNTSASKKILFGPGFNINKAFTNHDIILAGLLRQKGAEIHYPYGRDGFKTNYPFYGGVWDDSRVRNIPETLEKGEARAFKYFSKIGETYNIADYISSADLKEIYTTTSQLSEEEMNSFHYESIPIGHDSMNTVRNLNMVDQIVLVENYLEEWRSSLQDCMVYTLFLNRIINKIKPDIVIIHGNYYMPWSLLGKLAEKHEIKYYNYQMGLYPDTWIHANREPAMEFKLMDDKWLSNKDRSLVHEENNKLDLLVSRRKRGIVGNLKLDITEDKTESECLFSEIGDLPYAVYYTNLFWDAAALDKEILFSKIKDSLLHLVDWFSVRRNYHLVLKPHPAEKHKLIPETMYTVKTIIENYFNQNLPPNIHILKSETKISSYDLNTRSNLSITWTGTSGMESAIYGTPCIVLARAHYRGRGFTVDPNNIEELDIALEKHLASKQILDNKQIDLARKYFYLFQFELSKNVGIPTMRYDGKASDLKWKTAELYLKNASLENVIHSIVSMQDIT